MHADLTLAQGRGLRMPYVGFPKTVSVWFSLFLVLSAGSVGSWEYTGIHQYTYMYN